eukprot:scpid77511/ scgid33333/ Arylsulfatase B; N-acetylgalactosamine-4-sulfatase
MRSRMRIFWMAVWLFTGAWDGSNGQPVHRKPNLVFVYVDDWGFADVGFRNPAIHSPNFDSLARTGSVLQRHYVFKYCSPSRASLLTGRWPHHAHQWNLPSVSMAGTNLNMTMLPAKLKQAGYATHMVGKWHQGFFKSDYLPMVRGFDTMSGFLNGGENHMNQREGCLVDFWKNGKPDPRNGSYDAFHYRDDLVDMITNHDTDTPFFLYLALHNVHTPLQAPDDWVDIYPSTTCKNRRVYQAMVSVADNVTGTVVEMLRKKGMWNDTLMVVSADNGGAPCSGSNYPLKGCKGTFFEGGVRSLAFVNGGFLPEAMRGKDNDGFIHVADWYPTFCKLGGVNPEDSGPGKYPVDGLDVWPIISGQTTQTPHESIVLGFNFSHTDSGALIMGDYKLIVAPQSPTCDGLMYSPLDYPCSNGTVAANCDPNCLYNIVADPRETKDLAKSEPEIYERLLSAYNKYSTEPQSTRDQGYHSEGDIPQDSTACDKLKAEGGYWRPWRD